MNDFNYKFMNIPKSLLYLRKHEKNISTSNRNKQNINSIKLVFDYVCKLLNNKNLCNIQLIELIRKPSMINNSTQCQNCYNLLQQLEESILKLVNNISEKKWIKNDCDKRMGEIISICFTLNMIQGIQMLKVWKLRNPSTDLVKLIL